MTTTDNSQKGLSSAEAAKRLTEYGANELSPAKKASLLRKLLHILAEPMFILLLAAACIYFLLGEPRDGIVMLVFVVGIIAIDAVQEWKTDRTLRALRELSAPHARVIRDGAERTIPSTQLVPGDLMLIAEGVKIPADGEICSCADLAVDESTLTGEPERVSKRPADGETVANEHWRADFCYAGTLVTRGSGLIQVTATGLQTEYGKLAKGVAEAPEPLSPLKKQTARLVRGCAWLAAILFLAVALITWFNLGSEAGGDRFVSSVLSGVTLAMAMIPEEFPVILTVFLSMGAWRLAKKHSLLKSLPAVETLGAVSVLCVDKTGTITENRMTMQEEWRTEAGADTLLETLCMACEPEAYDPMEQAMLAYCAKHGIDTGALLASKLVHEYAFTDELKMMGHALRRDDRIVIAAKGSPERIFGICTLSDAARDEAERQCTGMSESGLRVIAVAVRDVRAESDVPKELTDCHLTLLGLVGLYDPPRQGVKEAIARCTRAGVRVVMITGDNGVTASKIAEQVGIPHAERILTGEALSEMDDAALREAVRTTAVFSRVLPSHKMRIVRALRENGEVVAMTGDGVNDAPALKYADIGIAMGKRGSEVSREAADLILLDDNFSTIVDTIRDGRRIYDNIKNAVGYVFTIHIPIAAASLLAPILGVEAGAVLLLPLHVVLLELVIDPTCSIALERRPAEDDSMERPPRDPNERLLSARLVTRSILQGLAIFAASFGLYYTLLRNNPENAATARSLGLAVIFLANLFLVQVNGSKHAYAYQAFKQLVRDPVMWATQLSTIALLLVMLYTPLADFMKLAPLSAVHWCIALAAAAGSVLWMELVKLLQNRKRRREKKD